VYEACGFVLPENAMLNVLRHKITGDRFDASLAEWVIAIGAVAMLVCGHIAVQRLQLTGLDCLAGYGLILVLTLLLANLAMQAAILRTIKARSADEQTS
jgi:hypothetical protein